MTFILCISPIGFAQTETNHAVKIRKLHRRYMQASTDHDIETLRALTHDDIIWYLGPSTFNGKDEVLKPNEFDKGYDTILEYCNVVVKGDTVRFDLLETNEQVKLFGQEGIRHYEEDVSQNIVKTR